ncbi:MAG: hypothetical protein K1X79_08750 [Oligoflexia bacterium]|nr:hypothetical protein [Oligoflexia bacterium]
MPQAQQDHNAHQPLTLATLAMLGVLELAGCGRAPQAEDTQLNFPVASAGVAPLNREDIPELKGFAQIYTYPGGVKVPVLHCPIQLTDPDPDNLRKILFAVPDKHGEVLDPLTSPWADPSKQAFFNCHAFALGETLGLTPNDSVNGARVNSLGYENPVGLLLPKFFDLKCSFEGETLNAPAFTHHASLSSGDRIFLVNSDGPSIEHLHSGRLVKRNGENWVVSKLGEDPLVVTPIDTLLLVYPTTRIEAWVPKNVR